MTLGLPQSANVIPGRACVANPESSLNIRWSIFADNVTILAALQELGLRKNSLPLAGRGNLSQFRQLLKCEGYRFRINLLRKFSGMTIGLVTLATMLTACTATHTSQPYLPSRENIVAGQTITVEGNKNLYAIAQEHHVSMREIIVLNNLQAPYMVKSGQQLILPAGASGGVASSAVMSAPQASSSAAVESAALPPVEMAPVSPAPSAKKPPLHPRRLRR